MPSTRRIAAIIIDRGCWSGVSILCYVLLTQSGYHLERSSDLLRCLGGCFILIAFAIWGAWMLNNDTSTSHET